MQLRYYQEEAVDAGLSFLLNNREGNPLIELPTGTGKSVVIAELVRRALAQYKGTRIMMLTHSKELVDQNSQKLRTLWPEAPMGIYSAGLNSYQTHFPITFAGIDSVASKPHIFGKQNILLVDEAKTLDWGKEGTRYRKFIEGLQKVNPRLRGVGLDATPWRHGVGHITNGGYWTHTCYSKIGVEDFHQFVQEGFLAPLYPLRTDLQIDVKGVGTTAGDYNQKALQDASDKEEITREAIQESLRLAGDRNHWLVFCTGTDHVDNTVRYLREAGISAMGVHSKQSIRENDLAIQMFRDGHIRALVNMGVLTTGFDAPHVDYIMMLRATQSAPLWVQMLGRGTRPCPWTGKTDCLVGDFAGNTRRLGPINDPVVPRPKGMGKGGPAPVRTCESCGCENHASARVCQRCGSDFPPPKTKLKTYAGSEELMKQAEDTGPQIEVMRVDTTSYSRHTKQGKPDMMKVTYACGFRLFSEYVCLQHEGFARVKARQWWKKRLPKDDAPDTVTDALEFSDMLPQVSHIRVWVNKPYPEIMDHCFDGTGWNQPIANEHEAPAEEEAPYVPPTLTMEEARIAAEFDGVEFDEAAWREDNERAALIMDDDIPF